MACITTRLKHGKELATELRERRQAAMPVTWLIARQRAMRLVAKARYITAESRHVSERLPIDAIDGGPVLHGRRVHGDVTIGVPAVQLHGFRVGARPDGGHATEHMSKVTAIGRGIVGDALKNGEVSLDMTLQDVARLTHGDQRRLPAGPQVSAKRAQPGITLNCMDCT